MTALRPAAAAERAVPLLEIDELSISYETRLGAIPAVSGVSLRLSAGESASCSRGLARRRKAGSLAPGAGAEAFCACAAQVARPSARAVGITAAKNGGRKDKVRRADKGHGPGALGSPPQARDPRPHGPLNKMDYP